MSEQDGTLPADPDDPDESGAGLLSPGMRLVAYGAFWFSLSTLMVKLAGQNLPFMEVVLGRSLFGALVCYWLMRRSGVSVRGVNRRLLWLRGGCGILALTGTFYSVVALPMADAIVIFYLHPVVAAVVSRFTSNETFNLRGLAGLALCVLGVVVISRPSFLFGAGAGLDPLGLAAGIGGAVFAGVTLVIVHELGKTDHPLTIILYLSFVALPVATVGSIGRWVTPNLYELALLVGIGFFTQYGQSFMTRGMALEKAGKASSAGYLQIVFVSAWGMLLFGDRPDLPLVAGAVCIFAGTAVTGYRRRKIPYTR